MKKITTKKLIKVLITITIGIVFQLKHNVDRVGELFLDN